MFTPVMRRIWPVAATAAAAVRGRDAGTRRAPSVDPCAAQPGWWARGHSHCKNAAKLALIATLVISASGGIATAAAPSARTIPHWSFTYADPTNNQNSTITMVGSDPRQNRSTTIKTEIIPVSVNFVAGNQDMSWIDLLSGIRAVPLNWTADPTAGSPSDVAETLRSPIFQSNHYPPDLGGDTGQYGDVVMRAQFNKIGSNYHVKLHNTAVLPAQQVDVSASHGVAYTRASGAAAGFVGYDWFSARVRQLINSLHIDPATAPIILTHNVMLCQGHDNYTNGCMLGYHGVAMSAGRGAAGTNGQRNNSMQTFIYSAYTNARFDRTVGANRGWSDIHALSHEVAEWLDDPFMNNAVQPFRTPAAPRYSCASLLETGDPVAGVWFGLRGNADPATNGVWHPQDEVFANWFTRDGTTPLGLDSWDGRYTFTGSRTTSISPRYAGFGTTARGC